MILSIKPQKSRSIIYIAETLGMNFCIDDWKEKKHQFYLRLKNISQNFEDLAKWFLFKTNYKLIAFAITIKGYIDGIEDHGDGKNEPDK